MYSIYQLLEFCRIFAEILHIIFERLL